MSIEADPPLGVPCGNDLQFPDVFGKWYMYIFQKGTFAYWSWPDGMVPRNLHMCRYLRYSDAQGFVVVYYSRKGEA